MLDQKYLLIIDNAVIDEKLKDYFAQFNFKIIQETNLLNAKNDPKTLTAILINWSLIQSDTTIIDTLYQQYSIPIIIISDTKNEDICVHLLESGADDFMIKPIHPRELHARISAITRRVQRSKHPIDNEKEFFIFTNWRLYPASRQLFNGHYEQLLSANEYNLLLAFVRQPQQILDRFFLSHIIHCSNNNTTDRRIDIQICRLRQKIEMDAKKPILIKTIRNNGYIFTAHVLLAKE